MAFKMRKDIKNSSYYVWFLGAQEAKGLRGPEYVLPVVKNLVEREKDVEPFKITLQVSSKGIKIIQNVPAASLLDQPLVPGTRSNGGAGYPKNQKTEVIKHFIPHHTLTYVLQDNDIVAYILLLFNPVTKCPVHVHAHRCDSVETAFTLTQLLQTLIDRPENQKKLNSIEVNLKTKGLLPPTGGNAGLITAPSSNNSKSVIKRPSIYPSGADSRSGGGGGSGGIAGIVGARKSSSDLTTATTTTIEPERALISRTPSQDRIANLYDSLAAELREKLGTGGHSPQADHAPILLPPRDYDTVHRQKGNPNILESRNLNAVVAGANAKNVKKSREALLGPMTAAVPMSKMSVGDTRIGPPATGGILQRTKIGSSGGSSGIGSDHAPSPEQDSETRFLDNESSSDEDWNVESSDDPLFLTQPHINSWRGVGGGIGGGGGGGGGEEIFLPKVRRHNSNGLDSNQSHSAMHAPIVTSPPETEIVYKRRLEPRDSRQQTPTSDLEINQVRSRRSESLNGHVEDFSRSRKIMPPSSKVSDRHEFVGPKKTSSESSQHLDPRRKKLAEQRQRSPSPSRRSVGETMSPLERFQDAKEKFLSMERERLEAENLMNLNRRKQMEQPVIPAVAKRNLPPLRQWRSRESPEEPEIRSENQPRSDTHDRYSYEEDFVDRRRDYPVSRSRESLDSDDFSGGRPNYRVAPDDRIFKYRYGSPPRRERDTNAGPGYRGKSSPVEPHGYPIDKYPQKTPVHHQNSDRGYDQNPRPAPRSYSEDCLQDNDCYFGNTVPYDEENIPLERYRSPTRINIARPHVSRQKAAAPTRLSPRINFAKESAPTVADPSIGVKRSNSRYFAQSYPDEPPISRRLGPAEPSAARRLGPAEPPVSRRPESVDDEKRKNFQELAKEFKRKSYQDHIDDSRYRGGFEREPLPQSVNNTPPRYRHSYAEPVHHRPDRQPPMVQHPHHGMLQRTNSFLASGRMGLAPVHPY